MSEFEYREKGVKTGFCGFVYVFYTVLFALSFFGFLILSDSFVEKQQQIVLNQAEIQEYKKQVEHLQAENRIARQEVENLKTLSGQELVARKQLRMIYADEMIVEWEVKDD
jgi:cell division protein FtsB